MAKQKLPRGLGNRKRATSADVAGELARQKLEADAVRIYTEEVVSYAEIAKRLGRSVGWVWNAINRRRQVNPDRDKCIAAANARLEPVMDVMRDAAILGDTQAANALAKLTSEHAKLNGLHAPTKTELSVESATLAHLFAELERR